MYQYSLQYYQALFNLCLKNSEPCARTRLVDWRSLNIRRKIATRTFAGACLRRTRRCIPLIRVQHPAARGQDPRKGVGAVRAGSWDLDRGNQPTNPLPEKIPRRPGNGVKMLCGGFHLRRSNGEEVVFPVARHARSRHWLIPTPGAGIVDRSTRSRSNPKPEKIGGAGRCVRRNSIWKMRRGGGHSEPLCRRHALHK